MPQYKLPKKGGKIMDLHIRENRKAQIDYVFINEKWKNSTISCEAYTSFEDVSSDHRIVTAKIRLSQRKNVTRTATTKHYDWALLNNRDIRAKYVAELRNRFETREVGKRDPKWRIWEFRQSAHRGGSEVYSNKT